MEMVPDHELHRLEAAALANGASLEELIERRLGGEPLQYIEGTAQFGPVELLVDERVLIPRPETETLFELASKMVRLPEVIVDLCTGSGALALALKQAFPAASVFATDISHEAIEVAMTNMVRAGTPIYLAEGDLFDPLPKSIMGDVDLIVANPPYVAESEFDSLPDDVKREPRVALVSGTSGLEVLQRSGAAVRRWLRPGGVIACEIGEKQANSAASSFPDIPVVVRQDLAGRDRYVIGVKP